MALDDFIFFPSQGCVFQKHGIGHSDFSNIMKQARHPNPIDKSLVLTHFFSDPAGIIGYPVGMASGIKVSGIHHGANGFRHFLVAYFQLFVSLLQLDMEH